MLLAVRVWVISDNSGLSSSVLTTEQLNFIAMTTLAIAPIDREKKKVKPSSLCYTPPAMINDKKRDRSYFRRGLLGEGGFARCFEVTDFQGTRLAAKCIAKKSITSEKVKMKLLGEIKVHKSMDHPNIVKQRDCFEDDVNVYMILDICTNGTLMEMLRHRKRFTETEVRYFGIQILGAAKYMHSRRVIHRDLKLGNLFLDENMCIKVGDFGLAALLVDDDDRKKTICGTPNYIAPEVLFGSAEGHSYEVDLWSIGVIFYAMLIGKPPFQSKDVKAIYAKIKTNEYDFPEDAEISVHAKDLITSLLTTDPDNRPAIDDIARHPFFNTGVMLRTLSSSAVKSAPDIPTVQSASTFRRNLALVTANAGIGSGHSAGKEQGKSVDLAVERPEGNRYLPVSLSPRTGPAAKMVNLQTERTGGRSISDRLNSVKLDDNLRRTTLGAGALRALQKENIEPKVTRPVTRSSRFQDLGKPARPQLSRPVSRISNTSQPNSTKALLTKLKEAIASPPAQKKFDDSDMLYISKWVDYSHRYGLGYQLSNESTGVYFNDTSSILLPPQSPTFTFITSTGSTTHPIDSPPANLEKKVYLMKHFRGYMTQHLTNTEATTSKTGYMTQYSRTDTGILFKLSDNTVQINFTNHTKLMITEELQFKFIDTKKKSYGHTVREALDHKECRDAIENAITMLESENENQKEY